MTRGNQWKPSTKFTVYSLRVGDFALFSHSESLPPYLCCGFDQCKRKDDSYFSGVQVKILIPQDWVKDAVTDC